MDAPEFERFLDRHFDYIQLIGLRMGLVSLGFQMDQTNRQANLPSALTYTGDHDGGKHAELKAEELWMDHPEFILAACSMKPLPADRGAASLFFSQGKDLWLDHQRALQQANGVEDEKQALRDALDAAEARLQTVSDDLKKALDDYAALDQRHTQQRQDTSSSITIARLLSRMTGLSSDSDPQSIIEQLFVLNQSLVEQRGQLDNALAMAAKTAAAERDAAALREQLAQTQSKLSDTKDTLDREQYENQKIAAQVNDLNLRLIADQTAPMSMPERPVISGVAEASVDWPPERLNDFWIPQKLRDFMVQGGNESEIDLFTYLCSVMEAFRDTPDSFPQSQPCQQIHDRVCRLSAARAAALPAQPDATIIIPVYNNVIDTLLCIASVLEDATSKSYEIIVADDGSTDATPQIVATLGGVVRYLRQPQNYGFLGNCNEAAKQAKGRHIVLLNNDTLVLPRWLDGLLDMFDQYEKIGLAGSKLISWDGSLQEAGGIYWKDGSAWNFGRGANAGAPEFNYVKDVDYVSGAAIAIPTDIWQAMDGFDDIYAPAYCEDSDIAFRLRDAGYRTLLNPASEVLHHEGRSHGRDLNSGIKAYQVKNQKTFLERWRSVLERDHYPNAHNVLRARDRSYYKKHVLIIDHYVPQWDQDAGSRSTFMCIKAMLNLGYAVTFWPENLWQDPQYTPILQEMGVEVIYGADYRNGFADFIRSRADLYDAVFAQRPHIACHFMKDIRENSQARILYYGHDLHYKRMMAAKFVGEPITDAEIADMRRQELDVCAQADVIFYPDQVEVDLVAQELGGDRVYKALPVYAFDQGKFDQSVSTLDTITDRTGFNLLFVGGFNHTPNQDGILWFVQDILPIIQRKLGEVHLTIVGSKATPAILSLASDKVNVAGFITDERLAQLYDETSLVIAPLRYGGGVKGKVIEAMATGIPLVTTPIGAQGLNTPEDLMFLATNADEFADAVVRALTYRSDAQARARNAWKYTKLHYSMQSLELIFQNVIS